MSAAYDRTSQYVIYASRAGVPPIASVASPQSGPDGTAGLTRMLALNAPGGPLAGQAVRYVIDIPVLCANVPIYSNSIVEGLSDFRGATSPPSGLWMRAVTNGTDSAILKNANWRSPYLGATIVDHDITLRNLYLDGQRRNAAGGNVSHAQINTNGQFCSPLQLYGVNGLTLDTLYLYDPIAFHVHVANIFGAILRRIKVLDPVQFATPLTPAGSRNTDGIHVNGPWDNLTIEDCEGTTGDDFLALNMVDGNLSATVLFDSGIQIYKDYSTVYYGSGGTTIVRNLRPSKACNFMTILWGSDPANNGVNPTVLSYLSVADVAGTMCWGPLNAQSGSNFGTGTGGSVTVGILKDWAPVATGTYPCSGIAVPPGTSFTVQGFKYGQQVASSLLHQIHLRGSVAGSLNVLDHQIFESSNVGTPFPAILIDGSNTTAELDIRGLKWSRSSNTGVPAVSVTAGTVTDLRLVDTYVNNLSNVVAVTGGTVGNISSSGLTHTNAGGGSSFALTPAIARFRAACSNVLSLLSGTAPTSKKTDGTEDA